MLALKMEDSVNTTWGSRDALYVYEGFVSLATMEDFHSGGYGHDNSDAALCGFGVSALCHNL